MAGVPGVVDLSLEQQTDISTLRIRPDAALAARHGLTAGEVSERIETVLPDDRPSDYKQHVRFYQRDSRTLTRIMSWHYSSPVKSGGAFRQIRTGLGI